MLIVASCPCSKYCCVASFYLRTLWGCDGASRVTWLEQNRRQKVFNREGGLTFWKWQSTGNTIILKMTNSCFNLGGFSPQNPRGDGTGLEHAIANPSKLWWRVSNDSEHCRTVKPTWLAFFPFRISRKEPQQSAIYRVMAIFRTWQITRKEPT